MEQIIMKSVSKTAGNCHVWEFNGNSGKVFLFAFIEMAGFWVVTSGL